MEKNEIRIGNVVYDSLNQSYDIVIGINNNDTVDFPFNLNNDIRLVDGVKISGEILKKLGFEKVNDTEEYYVLEYNNCDVHKIISLYEFNKMWCINISYSENILSYNAQSLHFRNIKYIHQIQNAYFILTGEELDVNNLLK